MYAAIVVYWKMENEKKHLDILVEHYADKDAAIEYVNRQHDRMKDLENFGYKFGRVYEVVEVKE